VFSKRLGTVGGTVVIGLEGECINQLRCLSYDAPTSRVPAVDLVRGSSRSQESTGPRDLRDLLGRNILHSAIETHARKRKLPLPRNFTTVSSW
jgi:hypothetical protein